jgi:hypothetical protein
MRVDDKPVEARSRRHVIRMAARLGAAATFTVLASKASVAAGRHSDPEFCEPVCLVRGSLVETAAGDVAIENLAPGDLIRSADGRFTPVRWIGRRGYAKPAGGLWPRNVDPVLVAASAIAPGVPTRDLLLSPKHALFIDGYLIPVMFLINGATIRQGAYEGDCLEYLHVECDAHEVMFAHGLAVETLRIYDDYEFFDNFSEHAGPSRARLEPYAPVLGYWNGKDDALGLLRSIASVCVDVRDPIQSAYDRIAARAPSLARELAMRC